MAATNGRYYLIYNTDRYDNIAHYRIDKMTDVKMLVRNTAEFIANSHQRACDKFHDI